MNFQISPLPAAQFAPLFGLSDAELARNNARRVTVDAKPGAPCRVSLADADVGASVLLVNHMHLSADTPYRASHAIYVREGAQSATPDINEVPDMLRCRVLSVRGFDALDMMIAGDVVAGQDLRDHLTALFDGPLVRYAHVHFAGRGCFAAQARPV